MAPLRLVIIEANRSLRRGAGATLISRGRRRQSLGQERAVDPAPSPPQESLSCLQEFDRVIIQRATAFSASDVVLNRSRRRDVAVDGDATRTKCTPRRKSPNASGRLCSNVRQIFPDYDRIAEQHVGLGGGETLRPQVLPIRVLQFRHRSSRRANHDPRGVRPISRVYQVRWISASPTIPTRSYRTRPAARPDSLSDSRNLLPQQELYSAVLSACSRRCR